MTQNIIDEFNERGRADEPFLFVIDYEGRSAYIKSLTDICPDECLYSIGKVSNSSGCMPDIQPKVTWHVQMPPYEEYERSFETVRRNIYEGNSYLANLTCAVPVSTNLTLRQVYFMAEAKYKLFIDRRFTCFSPETFIQIRDGKIYSYPMKGTIDASIPDAGHVLMADRKEAAEHATIVDLIRNDLSRVASHVKVNRYRYIERIENANGGILQTSSEICGQLPDDYRSHIGDILAAQLPAGSITGAPKEKTVSILHEAERYTRGFYTGVMGICDKGCIDSAVMIRFVEQTPQGMVFKAGGGITSKSDCHREYEEVKQKTYVPIR